MKLSKDIEYNTVQLANNIGLRSKYTEIGSDSTVEVMVEKIINSLRLAMNTGIDRQYNTITEEVITPKGRIDIPKTINRNSMIRGKVVCTYQEYTSNTNINKCIKALLKKIANSGVIRENQKSRIIALLKEFNSVDDIPLQRIATNRVMYNNNNIKYKAIISACKMIIDCGFKEELLAYSLFNRQLTRFIREQVGEEFKIEHISLNIEEEIEDATDVDIGGYGRGIAVSKDSNAIVIRTENHVGDKKKYDTERLKELAVDIAKYKEDSGKKASGLVISMNCNKDELLIVDKQLYVGNGVEIQKIVINIGDPYNILSGNIRKIVTEEVLKK